MIKSGQLKKTTADALQISPKAASDYKYTFKKSFIDIITDKKEIIHYANDNFCKISIYSTQELICAGSLNFNPAFHPKDFMSNLWLIN